MKIANLVKLFRINEVTKKIEPYMTTILKLKKRLVSFSIVVLLLSIACGTAVGEPRTLGYVIFYRSAAIICILVFKYVVQHCLNRQVWVDLKVRIIIKL